MKYMNTNKIISFHSMIISPWQMWQENKTFSFLCHKITERHQSHSDTGLSYTADIMSPVWAQWPARPMSCLTLTVLRLPLFVRPLPGRGMFCRHGQCLMDNGLQSQGNCKTILFNFIEKITDETNTFALQIIWTHFVKLFIRISYGQ